MEKKGKYLICLGCGALYGKGDCRCFSSCEWRMSCLDALDSGNKSIEGLCPSCEKNSDLKVAV